MGPLIGQRKGGRKQPPGPLIGQGSGCGSALRTAATTQKQTNEEETKPYKNQNRTLTETNTHSKDLATSTRLGGRAAGNQRTPKQGTHRAPKHAKQEEARKRNTKRGIRNNTTMERRKEKRREAQQIGRTASRWSRQLALKADGRRPKDTTFVNRANTNEEVYRRANTALGKKEITSFSAQHQKQKIKLMGHIIRSCDDDHEKFTTLHTDTTIPHLNNNRRAGQPRQNWAEETLKAIWDIYKDSRQDLGDNDEELDITNRSSSSSGCFLAPRCNRNAFWTGAADIFGALVHRVVRKNNICMLKK